MELSAESNIDQKVEWQAPQFEEIALNCEVAAYAPGDYGSESQPE